MSEADSDWYLRHRDGVEHGPFRLVDIVAAAAAGNVANDTAVRHATHTRDQWVHAIRVQPIAQAMQSSSSAVDSAQPAAAQSSPSAAPPDSSTTSRPVSPQPRTPAEVRGAAASPRVQHASRRSVFQQSSGQAASAPATDVADAASPVVGTHSESAPSIRSLREHNFPVPKTFLDAAVALFDFRFRHFVTPWIIKILWALAVAAALLWLAKLGADMFIIPLLGSDPSLAPEASSGWQFEPLQGNSIFQTRLFLYGVAAAVVGVLLLCTRMALEAGIVFFYVASDIRDLKNDWKQRAE